MRTPVHEIPVVEDKIVRSTLRRRVNQRLPKVSLRSCRRPSLFSDVIEAQLFDGAAEPAIVQETAKSDAFNVKASTDDTYDGQWLGDEVLMATLEEVNGTLAPAMNSVAADADVLANLMEAPLASLSFKDAGFNVKSTVDAIEFGGWALTNAFTKHDHSVRPSELGSEFFHGHDTFRGIGDAMLSTGMLAASESALAPSGMRIAKRLEGILVN